MKLVLLLWSILATQVYSSVVITEELMETFVESSILAMSNELFIEPSENETLVSWEEKGKKLLFLTEKITGDIYFSQNSVFLKYNFAV